VVVVIEARDIDIELTTQETAVAEFVAIELFGGEIGVGIETSEEGRSIRRGRNVTGEIKVRLGIGWRPQRMGKRRPDRLGFSWCLEQTSAGLQLRSGTGEIGA
jgi:hypothetical protein